MAKVVIALTSAQVTALLHVSKHRRGESSDYGAADGLRRRGFVRELPRRKGQPYYYGRPLGLTAAGRAAVALIRALGLHKPAPETPAEAAS